ARGDADQRKPLVLGVGERRRVPRRRQRPPRRLRFLPAVAVATAVAASVTVAVTARVTVASRVTIAVLLLVLALLAFELLTIGLQQPAAKAVRRFLLTIHPRRDRGKGGGRLLRVRSLPASGAVGENETEKKPQHGNLARAGTSC